MACGCSLAWLRAWLQEASSVGPRCADGSLLKERKLYRLECEGERSKEEPVLPGCETEIIQDIPLYGTSQVFSPWMEKIRDQAQPIPQVTNNVQMAPSPEESEYFYDEYVDYPFNDTNLVELSNSTLSKLHHGNRTLPNSTPSYHFVPGDTPTLYAGQNSNKTMLSPVNSGIINNGNAASNGGFTFFGMPLPTINIGKLWGSERKSERKASNGRSQDIEKLQLYNLTEPDLQAGGFIPLTPGASGGFTPISDPTSNITGNQRNNSNWPSDFPSHTSIDVTKKLDPFQSTIVDNGALFDSPLNSQINQTNYLLSPIVTTINQSSIEVNKHSFDDNDKVIFSNPTKPKNNENVITPLQNIESVYGANSVNSSVAAFAPNKGLTIDEIVEKLHKNKSSISALESMENFFNSSQSNQIGPTGNKLDSEKKFDGNDPKQSASPSALSVLTVPGQGQQYSPPIGRKTATITKVEHPHGSSEQTSPSSETFKSNNRGAKTSFYSEYDSSMKTNPYNNSFNWYYKNYNQSGLEPYIGPGVERFGSGQSTLKCDICVLSTLISFGIQFQYIILRYVF